MLFYPHWQRDKQLGPISLRAIIAWLAKQPAAEEYAFGLIDSCPMAQFLRASGAWNCRVDLERCAASWQSELAAIFGALPFTFGAALERARVALHR